MRSICLAILLVATAPALASQAIDVTHPATAKASIRIDNIAGSVTIVGWDQQSVHITGKLGSDDEHLTVNGNKGDIDIRVRYPGCHYHGHGHDCHGDIGPGTMLVIHAPRASAIEAETVSAPIKARQLTGALRLQAISGDITLHSKSREIDVKSINGQVNVTGSATKAHVKAGSIGGDVRVSNVSGELQANSISGGVTATHSQLRRAKLSSTSGDLAYSGAVKKDGVYEFHSTSGNVTLNLPAKPDARFDIETFSGQIRNEFGPKARRTGRYGPGRELHFTSGNGDAQVRVATMSGNVMMRAEK
jgi:hypothetical protein